MVHGCAHQCTCSLWQVCLPCSDAKREEFGLTIRSLKKMKTKRGLRRMGKKEGTCLPEDQVVFGGMWSHGIPDILVDFCLFIQSLHCPALQQVLVPVTLLPQHSCQNLFRTGRHLHGHLPQPQWKAIMHLEKQMERPCYLTYIVVFGV